MTEDVAPPGQVANKQVDIPEKPQQPKEFAYGVEKYKVDVRLGFNNNSPQTLSGNFEGQSSDLISVHLGENTLPKAALEAVSRMIKKSLRDGTPLTQESLLAYISTLKQRVLINQATDEVLHEEGQQAAHDGVKEIYFSEVDGCADHFRESLLHLGVAFDKRTAAMAKESAREKASKEADKMNKTLAAEEERYVKVKKEELRREAGQDFEQKKAKISAEIEDLQNQKTRVQVEEPGTERGKAKSALLAVEDDKVRMRKSGEKIGTKQAWKERRAHEVTAEFAHQITEHEQAVTQAQGELQEAQAELSAKKQEGIDQIKAVEADPSSPQGILKAKIYETKNARTAKQVAEKTRVLGMSNEEVKQEFRQLPENILTDQTGPELALKVASERAVELKAKLAVLTAQETPFTTSFDMRAVAQAVLTDPQLMTDYEREFLGKYARLVTGKMWGSEKTKFIQDEAGDLKTGQEAKVRDTARQLLEKVWLRNKKTEDPSRKVVITALKKELSELEGDPDYDEKKARLDQEIATEIEVQKGDYKTSGRRERAMKLREEENMQGLGVEGEVKRRAEKKAGELREEVDRLQPGKIRDLKQKAELLRQQAESVTVESMRDAVAKAAEKAAGEQYTATLSSFEMELASASLARMSPDTEAAIAHLSDKAAMLQKEFERKQQELQLLNKTVFVQIAQEQSKIDEAPGGIYKGYIEPYYAAMSAPYEKILRDIPDPVTELEKDIQTKTRARTALKPKSESEIEAEAWGLASDNFKERRESLNKLKRNVAYGDEFADDAVEQEREKALLEVRDCLRAFGMDAEGSYQTVYDPDYFFDLQDKIQSEVKQWGNIEEGPIVDEPAENVTSNALLNLAGEDISQEVNRLFSSRQFQDSWRSLLTPKSMRGPVSPNETNDIIALWLVAREMGASQHMAKAQRVFERVQQQVTSQKEEEREAFVESVIPDLSSLEKVVHLANQNFGTGRHVRSQEYNSV